jgi:hypothetical protein
MKTTKLLSYEEWKEKNISITDEFLEEMKTLHNISEELFINEIERMPKQEYDFYVMRTTDPEKFLQWQKDHYNEELGIYEVDKNESN